MAGLTERNRRGGIERRIRGRLLVVIAHGFSLHVTSGVLGWSQGYGQIGGSGIFDCSQDRTPRRIVEILQSFARRCRLEWEVSLIGLDRCGRMKLR